MKRVILSGVVGLLLFALQAPAQAATYNFSYSGSITSVSPGLTTFFAIGAPLSYSFTFTYDPPALTFTSPDLFGDPLTARYTGGTIVGSGSVTPILFPGGAAFTTGPTAIVRVGNNYAGVPLVGIERDYVNFIAPVATFAGTNLVDVEVRNVDLSALALSNLDLPNLALIASLFNITAVRLQFCDGPSCGFVISQTETPLPPALLLFLTGLGVMGFLAKRKKRSGTLAAAA